MGRARILHGCQFHPLKKVGNNVFKISRINELAEALGAPDQQAASLSFRVLLITHNAENKIDQALRDLSQKFRGHKWSLLAVDNGSVDNTADSLKDRSETIFAQLNKASAEEARNRAITLARAIYPDDKIILIELGKNPDTTSGCQSFCTVATAELWREAIILCRTLREFHAEPIYVICDSLTGEKIDSCKLSNVFTSDINLSKARRTTDEFYRNKRRNNFHRPDAILRKMDVMEWAIAEQGATFFLDADIVPVSPIGNHLPGPICLSPHYHKSPANGMQYGFFNAGYVYASDSHFPAAWRDLYLNRSKFYEQEGMTYLVEQFPISLFSREHNVGFWRRGFDDLSQVKSFHAHLTFDLSSISDNGLRRVYGQHREEVKAYLSQHKPELYNIVEESTYEME